MSCAIWFLFSLSFLLSQIDYLFTNMVLSCNDEPALVYDFKLSSVGPSRVTGEDVTHEPNGKDLAMKLHYIKGVYFFNSQASQGLTIKKIKESTFFWLNDYYKVCGRFRRSEAGRPYLKCNDCGVRFVEAQCNKTLDEWLELRDYKLNNLLVYHKPIGPELFFSPPVFLQVTKFKCGGMSLGISWAHVLGDAFSASHCLSKWTQYLAGLKTNAPIRINTSSIPHESYQLDLKPPLSLKQVDPVGDHWITPNEKKMEAFSLYLTSSQASNLHSNICRQSQYVSVPFFETISAMIWKSVANVREGTELKTVTLCKKHPHYPQDGMLSNNQIISMVKADLCVAEAELKELALILFDQATEEMELIEAVVEKDNGALDYVVYGANLTFIDLEGADLYGFTCNDQTPEFVCYGIEGIGDAGAVWVMPCPKGAANGGGKVVTVVVPENEVAKLKIELARNGILPH